MDIKLTVDLKVTEQGQQLMVQCEPMVGTIEALGMLELAKEHILRIGFFQPKQEEQEVEISD